MPPLVTVRVLTFIAAVTATTALTVVLVAAAAFLTRSTMAMTVIGWCPIIPLHREIGLAEGVVVFVLLSVVVWRVGGVVLRHRRAVAGTNGQRFQVLDTPQPIAYAVPGKPGCVVVSNGLLSALDPWERQVLFAHERAHLHQNHHRFLFAGALAVAVVPLLRPLVGQLRMATERCADEAAVVAVGGDRWLVAASIARAAWSPRPTKPPTGVRC